MPLRRITCILAVFVTASSFGCSTSSQRVVTSNDSALLHRSLDEDLLDHYEIPEGAFYGDGNTLAMRAFESSIALFGGMDLLATRPVFRTPSIAATFPGAEMCEEIDFAWQQLFPTTGSGTLIDSEFVLTAGHAGCVGSAVFGIWHSSVDRLRYHRLESVDATHTRIHFNFEHVYRAGYRYSGSHG